MQFQLRFLSRHDTPVPIGSDHIARVLLDLRWTVINTHTSNELAIMLLSMGSAVNVPRRFGVRTTCVQPGDCVGLKLMFEGETTPCCKMSMLSDNSLAKLLEMLSKVLQSNEALHLN